MRYTMIICVIALLIISGCKTQETTQTTNTGTTINDVIPDETETAPASGQFVSELMCIDDKITGVITNIEKEQIQLNGNVKVMLNGNVVVDSDCEKLVLEPGESTTCADLSGHFAIRTGKVNTMQFNLIGKRFIEYVDCAVKEI